MNAVQSFLLLALICFVLAVYFILDNGFKRSRNSIRRWRKKKDKPKAAPTIAVIVRSQDEVNNIIQLCYESMLKEKTNYPEYTFEDGVRWTLEWLTTEGAVNPFD